MNTIEEQFIKAFNNVQKTVYKCAIDKGWWDMPKWWDEVSNYFYNTLPDDMILDITESLICNKGEKIALMHAELSECLEAIRDGNPPDNKIPEFSAEEVELADVIIRIMDYAGYYNLRIAKAIVAKHKFNLTRSYKHGGKSF